MISRLSIVVDQLQTCQHRPLHTSAKLTESLISLITAADVWPWRPVQRSADSHVRWPIDSRKVASMTDTSVAVVSSPVKAHQSLTTRPAPMTSDPRLTVPATKGICRSDESSSCSERDVLGWTRPPYGGQRRCHDATNSIGLCHVHSIWTHLI
jgi:hypothetical protein